MRAGYLIDRGNRNVSAGSAKMAIVNVKERAFLDCSTTRHGFQYMRYNL